MTTLGRALAMMVLGLGLATTARAAEHELLVSAAVSLKETLTEAAKAFEGSHPGVRVALNFAASGQLRAQIESGAPVDAFVPASVDDVATLEARGLVRADSRVAVARNVLVLVTGGAPGLPVHTLADLARPEVHRLAVGNPASVPAGRYAREALEHAGLWDRLRDRTVLAENVRQVLDYVARGEVDAGLVYRTDAATEGRVRVVQEVPAEAYAPIVYPAAVVTASREPDLARAFVAFLASPEGRALFERHGFGAPPAVR